MTALGLARVTAHVGCLAAAGWLAVSTVTPSRPTRPTRPVLALSVVGNDSIDLGELRQGEPVATAFQVRNDSRTAIQIDGVTSTCGCTIPTITTKELAPGESATVDVQFNTKGVRGISTQYVVTRFAEGPKSPILELPFQIDASVIPDYRVKPLNLQPFSRKSPTQEMAISPHAGESCKITGTKVDRAWFKATHREAQPGGGQTVRVEFLPTMYEPFGGDAMLVILVDSPGQPSYSVRLQVENGTATPTQMPGLATGATR